MRIAIVVLAATLGTAWAQDIKMPPAFDKLAAKADVVIENYKLGGLAKYGLDYDSLKTANPKLVYRSITGFGPMS